MPKYDDDQCVRCGAIRAAGSSLCVDCLVTTVNSFGLAQDIAEAKSKELEEKVKRLTLMCDQLLIHLSSEEIHIAKLRMMLLRVEGGVNA